MKSFRSLVIALTIAAPAGAQRPTLPVPTGKDSAAVAAIFDRHMKASTLPGKQEAQRYMHVKQQMEMQGSPPVEMEHFMVMASPGVPGKVRSLMNMPMMGAMETVVNGKLGWVIAGGQAPMLLQPEQIEQAMMGANPNPISSLPAGTLTIAGKATIDGREMNGVRVVDSLGTDAIIYFDAKTGLASAVRTGSTRGLSQDTSVVMLMTDYKAFNGSLMPTTMTVRQGAMQQMVMKMVLVESTPIDTMMFVPPPAVLEMYKLKKP